uniref:Methyltransferase-like protein 7A-like n=1 Tax=Saccoglossus kowalevskii TaxID=10224 RepID=A0ABM0MJZ9_SACKO|nr:PREDICTED: methyltransferase-like protein 7A-like [Saccoglossus kowalevskii]
MIYPSMMDGITVNLAKDLMPIKRDLFADLPMLQQRATRSGDDFTVLEIGVGTGANFEYYPEGTKLIPVDPMAGFDSYIDSNAKKFSHINVQKLVLAFGENMEEVADDSVDVVVVTWVLCCVENVDGVMTEIKRVLKPGGKFYFMEHTAALRNSWTHVLQRLLNPAWRKMCGCSMTEETWKAIDKAGFSKVQYERFNAPLSWTIKPHLVGHAVK